jgi:hypothetical protein
MNSWYLPEWMKGLGTRQFQVVACSRENPAKAKWVWAYLTQGQIVCFCSKHKLLMFAANRLQLVRKQWCSVHEFCWWNQLLPIFNWKYNKTGKRTKTHKYCYMTQLIANQLSPCHFRQERTKSQQQDLRGPCTPKSELLSTHSLPVIKQASEAWQLVHVPLSPSPLTTPHGLHEIDAGTSMSLHCILNTFCRANRF